jgi:hypothetical protein
MWVRRRGHPAFSARRSVASLRTPADPRVGEGRATTSAGARAAARSSSRAPLARLGTQLALTRAVDGGGPCAPSPDVADPAPVGAVTGNQVSTRGHPKGAHRVRAGAQPCAAEAAAAEVDGLVANHDAGVGRAPGGIPKLDELAALAEWLRAGLMADKELAGTDRPPRPRATVEPAASGERRRSRHAVHEDARDGAGRARRGSRTGIRT